MRDVLVDDPQTLRIDCQDERVANLANGAKRAQRIQPDRCVVIRTTAEQPFVAARHGCSGCHGTSEVCGRKRATGTAAFAFDSECRSFELQPRIERRDVRRTQGKRSIGLSCHLQFVSCKIARLPV